MLWAPGLSSAHSSVPPPRSLPRLSRLTVRGIETAFRNLFAFPACSMTKEVPPLTATTKRPREVTVARAPRDFVAAAARAPDRRHQRRRASSPIRWTRIVTANVLLARRLLRSGSLEAAHNP